MYDDEEKKGSIFDRPKKRKKKEKKSAQKSTQRTALSLFEISNPGRFRRVASIDRAGVNEDVIVDDDVFSSLLSGEKNSRRPRWIWM